MKKWMPLGALALIVAVVVLVLTTGPLKVTGNARGLSADNASKVTASKKPESKPTLTCANVLCVAGTTCVNDCEDLPVCVPQVCEGIAGKECPEGFVCDADGENPDEGGACQPDCDDSEGPTCDTIRCAKGTTCVEDCDDKASCVPNVCGGIAGVMCPDGFVCETKGDYPDAQGSCETDCDDAECGTCKSDDECKKGERCTASEDCLADCDCPQCTVCAGHCVEDDE